MNKIILMGRLTKDPEIRYSQSNEPVAIVRYTLAVNRRFKREGEPDADFINCVAFGKTGEFAEKYFSKGQMVAVSGRLQIRTYDDPNGQRRWFTEVIIEEQHFAESKSATQAYKSSNSFSDSDSDSSQGFPDQGSGSSNKKDDKEEFFAIDESLDDEDLPF